MINRKQLKKIPKKSMVIWFVIAIFFAWSTIQVFLPVYRTLEDTQTCILSVENVRLIDTHSVRGSRMRLELVSEGQTYYLWYPKSHYKEYADIIEQELLSGEITSVTAMVSKNVSLRDSIFDNKRIVDLRSETSIYYDIELEKISLYNLRISSLVASLLSLIVLVIDTGYLLMIYGKVSCKK